jgi:lysylphosphatidylglycerol synthetase-like protein (DUF2156 family)
MFATIALPLLQTFAAGCAKPTFFGLVPWYQYLNVSVDAAGRCAVTDFNGTNAGPNFVLGSHSSFLLIGLAILDDLIRVAAMVSVGYVIYGGIQYMTSQGSPDMTKKAQQTIINALIGVAIALISVGIVSFIGNRLG